MNWSFHDATNYGSWSLFLAYVYTNVRLRSFFVNTCVICTICVSEVLKTFEGLVFRITRIKPMVSSLLRKKIVRFLKKLKREGVFLNSSYWNSRNSKPNTHFTCPSGKYGIGLLSSYRIEFACTIR